MFNLPKFFEAEIDYVAMDLSHNSSYNNVRFVLYIHNKYICNKVPT
jgi:hypothetical protein